ncbi:IS256 family transposase [Alicyclobacillus sp. SO9]|uniref:IS256 family transposase n=1 Tax=Alicyclobacillus sp. SO9 TaxID=2665646 RepID=UPI0018E78D3D|nr:IS256 family transposase [Alicyclobacillus sp. SO9]QQE77275.1 IS256 family transposase [Alicyclobacillus sp. SO9]QQE78196.1 IS256 family transposase [Alicyclobacillus sp. SO9]QQE79023.1 IS256 family transposase [Alicyclobacillus sp. SO9]
MDSVHEQSIGDLMENLVKGFVKEKLEFIMREEIEHFLNVEYEGRRPSRNGYYGRSLQTRYGEIEDLQVPRDRKDAFQTQLFEPYQRREGWLEEAVIHMYKGGMSTRDVAKFIEGMFGTEYSPTTISNITKTVLEDVEEWQQRPLEKRYSVIYLDGIYIKLKRTTVDSEVVYLAMGINEDGYRQILGFYVGGKESANGWKDVLKDLYNRGVHEVLLGVFDGLPGLEEAFREIYSKADVQHCVVHKVRSTFPKIRVGDKTEFLSDLKTVYTAPDKDLAVAAFDTVKDKWGKKYSKEIQSWEGQLSTLLTFYKYPKLIRHAIYTSNAIERTNKELRKRFRPMNSLTNMDAAEKIIYLEVTAYNEKWSTRVIRGFGDEETKAGLQRMYEERYPAVSETLDKE